VKGHFHNSNIAMKAK